MARLRDPEHGCPWDREQDFATLAAEKLRDDHGSSLVVKRTPLRGMSTKFDLNFFPPAGRTDQYGRLRKEGTKLTESLHAAAKFA
jgi:hypothetical protein